MSKSIYDFLSSKKQTMDVDFHQFIYMVENGLNEEEIAKELGVDKKQIYYLERQLQRD